MSEEKQIQVDAVEALFLAFINGAVLDGKRFTEVINPYDHCVKIVQSWEREYGYRIRK